MLNCPYCRQNLSPHEIGVLYAALGRARIGASQRFWKAKLTGEAVNDIRQSKEPIKELAKKHHVSFATIWRAKENITYKGQTELRCPHCGHDLTQQEIGKLFATLGGSTSSPRKAKTAAANGRKVAKLTEKGVAHIRKSNAPPKKLAKKHKVHYSTINQIRRKERWKSIPSK